MIRLAHISDVHISSPWQTLPRMFTSKRLMGGMNMLLFRRRELRNATFPLVLQHIQQQSPDLVLLTGDISTTALPHEFAHAQILLDPVIKQDKLVTIPGNHDVYTARAQQQGRYELYFSSFHGEPNAELPYPFVRRLDDKLTIIGLNSCVPTGLSGSWGILDEAQLTRLPELLLRYKDSFRVIMIHHFLQDKHGTPGLPRRGLRNRNDFLRILKKYGAEMILHGHEHACYTYNVPGKQGPIPVFCPGPATRHSLEPIKQGGYQLYEIEDGQLLDITRFHYDPTIHDFRQVSTKAPV